MALTPTPEQRDALDAFDSGDDMKLEAFAGTGKTSTLKMLANSTTDKGVYLAFNSATARDARGPGGFPRTTDCRTAHSFGYRWLMEQWGETAVRDRLNGQRHPAYMTANILGIKGPTPVGHDEAGTPKAMLAPKQVARLVMDTIKNFCQSADPEPSVVHVPRQRGLEAPDDRAELAAALMPYVRMAWADLSTPTGGLRYSHDCYLKAFALTDPVLPCDYLLVDECQDTNPVVADLVGKQRAHAQLVAVGDSNQAIYGWRGATDYLATLEVDRHLYLTQSWRFGPAVASEANKWLRLLGVERQVKGSPHLHSMIARLATPDAVLTRSNAEAVGQLMTFQAEQVPVCIAGDGTRPGGGDFKTLALAAQELQESGKTSHHELAAFTSWDQVRDYVQDSADGADLAVAVDLIDDWGADAIVRSIDGQVDEARAQVIVSTAHKAKGREWARVRIAEDFRCPKPEQGRIPVPEREEMMLAYVAVTRAKEVLDPRGLNWVNDVLAHLAADPLGGHATGRAAYEEGRRLGLLPTPWELARAE